MWGWLPLSTMLVLGIEPRSLGLAAGVFIHQAISPAFRHNLLQNVIIYCNVRTVAIFSIIKISEENIYLPGLLKK